MRIKLIIAVLKSFSSKNRDLFLEKISRRLRAPVNLWLWRFLRRKENFKAEEAIVVFSEARGGSTWVMEQLQSSLKAISIFEPLWGLSGAFKKYNHLFSSPFYFGKRETEKILYQFLKDTLVGKESSKRSLQFNNWHDLMQANKLLVKIVNTNLIAPWFVSQFKLKYRPVYVLRHPLAILYSRETYSADKKDFSNNPISAFDWSRIKSDEHPYHAHASFIDEHSNLYERYLVEWCIRNKDFLEGRYDNKFLILYYEELVSNRVKILQDIAKEYQIESIRDLPNQRSGTTALNSAKNTDKDQLAKWQQHYSKAELASLQAIFDYFGIVRYSAYSKSPIFT